MKLTNLTDTRPIFRICIGILLRVSLKRNTEILIPLFNKIFTLTLTLLLTLGFLMTLRILFTIKYCLSLGFSFDQMKNKLKILLVPAVESDGYEIYHIIAILFKILEIRILWNKAIKLDNFNRIFNIFIFIIFISKLYSLFRFLIRIVVITLFGSIIIIWNKKLSNIFILYYISDKILNFYESILQFSIPRTSLDILKIILSYFISFLF